MKVLMLIGGVTGFAIGAACGWNQDCPASEVLWRAALGTYAGGLLLRWWGRHWLKNFRDACEEKLAAAEAAAAKATPKPAQPSAPGRS
jgi:hypothetical protein